VWITGLPCAGKTTLGRTLERRLSELGRTACLLDGDAVRQGLSSDLGFSAADRSENARRVAEAARLLAEQGTVAVVALVSPYEADRRAARRVHADAGLRFVEVWLATPPEECERRDPKGLWARARAGEIDRFTGVGDPYEPPANADVAIEPGLSPETAAERVLAVIP
jgi:adenylyl-sulfate kinase